MLYFNGIPATNLKAIETMVEDKQYFDDVAAKLVYPGVVRYLTVIAGEVTNIAEGYNKNCSAFIALMDQTILGITLVGGIVKTGTMIATFLSYEDVVTFLNKENEKLDTTNTVFKIALRVMTPNQIEQTYKNIVTDLYKNRYIAEYRGIIYLVKDFF